LVGRGGVRESSRPPRIPCACRILRELVASDRSLVVNQLRKTASSFSDKKVETGRRSVALIAAIAFSDRHVDELRFIRAPQENLLPLVPADAHEFIHPWIEQAHSLNLDTPDLFAFCALLSSKPGGLIWRERIDDKVSQFLRRCQPDRFPVTPTRVKRSGSSPMRG
jgi:hypothetical protein